MEILGLAWDWSDTACLVWPFLYLGGKGLWNHIPVGITSCIVAMQVCLLGSFWRWIQVACGLIWLWMTVHRCKCGISLLQRQQLASLSQCLCISIQFQWGPCWQKLWVCHSAGVLHQGLPVRHQLGLSWVVMGQSTWGWCHWWQLPWSTQKWCHRYSSNWSLCPSWATLIEGQSRWIGQGWRDLGMWLDLRTPEAQWCWWVLVRCVQHQPFQGLGGYHWHHRGIQRNWWLGPSCVFSVDWTPSPICGQYTWDLIGGCHVLPQCSHLQWCHQQFQCILGILQGSAPSFSGRCLWSRPSQREVVGNGIFQKGLLKVVSKLESCSRMIDQYPWWASNLVKKQERANSWATSSTVGILWWSQQMALLRPWGSKHRHSLPFAFWM